MRPENTNQATDRRYQDYSELMQRSYKAALLSGLIFPGIGHLYLGQRLRGWLVMLTAIAATALIAQDVIHRALGIVEQINSGGMLNQTDAIAEMVAKSGGGPESQIANAALIVLGLCWLFGVVDSFRLGNSKERQTLPSA